MRTSVVALLYLALVIFSRHFGFCACVYSLVVEDKSKWRVLATMKKGTARSDSIIYVVILIWTKRLVKKLGLRIKK